jgi:hypothetical protein
MARGWSHVLPFYYLNGSTSLSELTFHTHLFLNLTIKHSNHFFSIYYNEIFGVRDRLKCLNLFLYMPKRSSFALAIIYHNQNC